MVDLFPEISFLQAFVCQQVFHTGKGADHDVSFDGRIENFLSGLLEKKFPQYIRSNYQKYNYRFPRGDCFRFRVINLRKKIKVWKSEYHNKTILLSTHGYIKKAILIALGVTTFKKINNVVFENASCSLIAIKNGNDKAEIIYLNETKYLDSL